MSVSDDIMMFLNAIVAIICFVYALNLAVLSVKGWAVARGELAITSPKPEELA
jgi:hypothetical protein